jgi:formyl-CoA transferase
VSVQAALVDATFFPLHDRLKPPNATFNVYRSSDDNWFLLVVTPDHWPALATGIGRPDLLTDARFADAAKLAANATQLTAILDELFGSRPMAHWHEVLDAAHVTFGVVRAPSDVIKDPQLVQNDIIVPLEGAGGHLTLTVSSPFKLHDVPKVPAQRAPELGEHGDEILKDLGFDAKGIESLRASGTVPAAPARASDAR